MDNNLVKHGASFELEAAASSWRQKSSRNASDSSLHSSALSEDRPSRHSEQYVAENSNTFTANEERAVVKKLDRHLVLFLAFLYMLSFLDRSSMLIRDLKSLFCMTID